MKKALSILLLVLAIFILGCNEKEDLKKIIEESFQLIELPNETNSDLDFKNEITYKEYTIKLTWSTSNDAISSSGKVTLGDSDVVVDVFLKGQINEETFEKKISSIKVLKKVEVFDEKSIESALESINFPNEICYNIDFLNEITYQGYTIKLTWSGDGKYVSNEGVVLYPKEDTVVSIKLKAEANSIIVNKEYSVTILSAQNACIKASNELNLPEKINDNITLPQAVNNINIDWSSSNEKILNISGICSYVPNEEKVVLSAGFYVDLYDGGEHFYDVDYEIIVMPFSSDRLLKEVEKEIDVPSKVYRNIQLKSNFNYGITGVWSSSAPDVLSSSGVVKNSKDDVVVKLTVELSLDSKKVIYDFDVTVVGNKETENEINIYDHNIVDRVADFDASRMNNLELKNNKVVLKEGALEGKYESKIFNTLNFKNAVGSYSCITNVYATSELEISIRINGTWTKYFTYGNWGLGKDNIYYNQTDTLAKMSVDEIIVKEGAADAIKYRITLRRNKATIASPQLSLVAMALSMSDSNYKYGVSDDLLPKAKDNDLPKLYQYDVKEVGGSICSATTTTMLLKWKGHDFKNEAKTYRYNATWGEYEHGYIADLVADRGHNSPTFGNWSYNMITAGAFGEDAYVARMYSWEEMKDYLANHGPLGASIKSPTGLFGYNTNGHLIVVRGYRVTDSGDTIVICNDPAVKGTYYEVRLYQFMGCWGGVVYIVE